MEFEFNYVIALLSAAFLGGAIGFERGISGKPAGLRTNTLICLGAAVLTLIARSLSSDAYDAISRVMAGVVTGVGFIGAGALIRDNTGKGIQGLTTAASIWLVASIGIACGAGFYCIAILTTAIALFVLHGLSPLAKAIEKRVIKKKKQKQENKH